MGERYAFARWSLALALVLALLSLPSVAEEAAPPDDWTIMLYMCGSDLESRNGMASFNLNEISQCSPMTEAILQNYGLLYQTEIEAMNDVKGKVNVLIETGGCKRWQAKDSVGLDIAADRLQRYEYDPVTLGGFVLQDEQPLASMSAPETLADFIRWGVQTRPAQKYALVLWDHGGGSRTGLFVDELFDGEVMELDELAQGLEGGGTHLDVLIIDACMMANLETAQAVAPYADYMVASEEVVAGYGGAYTAWLNYLYLDPQTGSRQFARIVCDAVQRKYADLGNERASNMLTCSVIDLSMIDPVAEAFDALMQNIGRLYEDNPMLFNVMGTVMERTEHYGLGDEHMIDIGSILRQWQSAPVLDAEVRDALSRTLTDAIIYTVKGPARSSAFGLSFCYDLAMSPEQLDRYARNCRCASYLALLDVINPDWIAPDWVYQQTRPLKPLDEENDYRLEMSASIENGQPQLELLNSRACKSSVDYVLYSEDRDSGQLNRLGMDSCDLVEFTLDRQVYGVFDLNTWPALDGVLCDIEKVNENTEYVIYNIPIQMGEDVYDLRASYLFNTSLLDQARQTLQQVAVEEFITEAEEAKTLDYSGYYELYGVWEGYDADVAMPNRNSTPFVDLQGQEFELLYPIYEQQKNNHPSFSSSGSMTIYRGMELVETPLPEGVYYISFIVTDVFGRTHTTDMIRMEWDGEKFQ